MHIQIHKHIHFHTNTQTYPVIQTHKYFQKSYTKTPYRHSSTHSQTFLHPLTDIPPPTHRHSSTHSQTFLHPLTSIHTLTCSSNSSHTYIHPFTLSHPLHTPPPLTHVPTPTHIHSVSLHPLHTSPSTYIPPPPNICTSTPLALPSSISSNAQSTCITYSTQTTAQYHTRVPNKDGGGKVKGRYPPPSTNRNFLPLDEGSNRDYYQIFSPVRKTNEPILVNTSRTGYYVSNDGWIPKSFTK